MGEREPMSAERLAELRDAVERNRLLGYACEPAASLIAEIDRLRGVDADMRARIATLHDDLAYALREPDAIRAEMSAARAEVAALRREPGPRVPDAPGWWWWRVDATSASRARPSRSACAG